MILLPRPTDFVDWKAWATELTRRLDRSDPIKQVAEALVTGDNLSATYDASKRTITLAAAATTDEMIDDRVAALLVQGANITLTYNDVANTLTIAAADSGLDVLDEGTTISGALFDTLDFVGAGVTVTDAGGGVAEVSIPGGSGSGGVVVLDESTTIAGAAFDTIDFVGAGVTVTDAGGGVAEVSIPGGGTLYERPFTIPVSSSFTWVNQGTATVTDETYGMVMKDSRLSSLNLRLLVKSAPTPPYEIIAKAWSAHIYNDNTGVGLAWRESGTGKIHFLRHVVAGGVKQWVLSYYTSPTAYSSNSSFIRYGDDKDWWIRLRDDNTNRLCDISPNGYHWINILSTARGTPFTPDQVGFCFDNLHGGASNLGIIVDWKSWEEL